MEGQKKFRNNLKTCKKNFKQTKIKIWANFSCNIIETQKIFEKKIEKYTKDLIKYQ